MLEKENLCSQSNMCHFRIPFTGKDFLCQDEPLFILAPGSGISIFVIQSNDPLNATMTLDGDTPTITSLAALSGPANLFTYNVTLYTTQLLAAADHTLDIALLDYVNSDGTSKGSIIRFDSALVNDTSSAVVSPTVIPQSPSSTGTGTASSIVPAPSGSSGTSHSS